MTTVSRLAIVVIAIILIIVACNSHVDTTVVVTSTPCGQRCMIARENVARNRLISNFKLTQNAMATDVPEDVLLFAIQTAWAGTKEAIER